LIFSKSTGNTRRSATVAVALLVTFPAIAVLPATAAGPAASTPPASGGAVLPVELVDGAGLAKTLGSHRDRIVVLNFWATWCDPCREEFPDLVRLAAEHPDDLLLVAVSLDDPDVLDSQVRPFLVKSGFKGLALIKAPGDPDAFINSVDSTWSGALPATFVHGPGGKRVSSIHGATSYAALRKIVDPLARPAK
jgi:thiol-disulfide isomerase/thioredoxin